MQHFVSQDEFTAKQFNSLSAHEL